VKLARIIRLMRSLIFGFQGLRFCFLKARPLMGSRGRYRYFWAPLNSNFKDITVVELHAALKESRYIVFEYGQSHIHILPGTNHREITFYILFGLFYCSRGIEGSWAKNLTVKTGNRNIKTTYSQMGECPQKNRLCRLWSPGSSLNIRP